MSAAKTLTSTMTSKPGNPTEVGGLVMSAADFEKIRALIHQYAGITLSQGKKAMAYSRLSRRLRETEHASFASYLQWITGLTGEASALEWQRFVNALTTNLTAFFREAHHFPVLAAELKARRSSPVRIWCNAASTGEEPYSISMTVLETLGIKADVTIICSDIDTNVLTRASHGVYEAAARGLSPERLRRHFLRGQGANSGMIRVKHELARPVEFRQFNLMDERWSLGAPFDFVFCRNVMIYFDAHTQRRVLERMHHVMKKGSLLFAGHSENFNESRDLFCLRAQTVYERI